MFCAVNVSACLEISDPAPGRAEIDLPAASKNIPNAFSAWSIVFSAKSRNSAGTSSVGSAMLIILPYTARLPYLPGGVFAMAQHNFFDPGIARSQDLAAIPGHGRSAIS